MVRGFKRNERKISNIEAHLASFFGGPNQEEKGGVGPKGNEGSSLSTKAQEAALEFGLQVSLEMGREYLVLYGLNPSGLEEAQVMKDMAQPSLALCLFTGEEKKSMDP